MLSVFVNGARSGNPSVGAWGFILQRQEQTLLEYLGVVEEERSTTHRMELVAVIEGLKSVLDCRTDLPIRVFSESGYLRKTVTGEWTRKKNGDLWERFECLTLDHNIEWTWVEKRASCEPHKRANSLTKLALERREALESAKRVQFDRTALIAPTLHFLATRKGGYAKGAQHEIWFPSNHVLTLRRIGETSACLRAKLDGDRWKPLPVNLNVSASTLEPPLTGEEVAHFLAVAKKLVTK
jgi:ribonuclease HI